MNRVALILIVLLVGAPAIADPPASVPGELEHTEAVLEQLVELRAQVTAMGERLDALIRATSERKGAVANAKPAPFGGAVTQGAGVADRPDQRPRVVRCAALTKDGERCSRAALPGQRYCKQHALAKTK